MEIKTGNEIVNLVGSFKVLVWDKKEANKKWVAVNELKEELFKICDDVKSLISTHNLQIEDKYLHTLYLGTVNKMLNQFNKKYEENGN